MRHQVPNYALAPGLSWPHNMHEEPRGLRTVGMSHIFMPGRGAARDDGFKEKAPGGRSISSLNIESCHHTARKRLMFGKADTP